VKSLTFKFFNPWTLSLEVEVQTVKPGAAETVIADATRATREEGRVEGRKKPAVYSCP